MSIGKELPYLQGAHGLLPPCCGMSHRDADSNEDTYRRFRMSEAAVEMKWGVTEVQYTEMVWVCTENE